MIEYKLIRMNEVPTYVEAENKTAEIESILNRGAKHDWELDQVIGFPQDIVLVLWRLPDDD